uniref:Acyltransferase n=1 Tax=Globisporangium ultimum (strain ATCC 200006 / CBS 805.95 / DAOM BR144) TaxID=431595 RepID=K3WBZ3_GLOUD
MGTLRRQLKSLAGVGGVYALWVVGLLVFTSLYGYTFLWLGRVLWSALAGGNDEFANAPVPRIVTWFIGFVVVYESYHWLFPVGEWPFLQRAARSMLTKYPYFRLNACIFEEELEQNERRAEHQTKMVLRSVTLACDQMTPFAKPQESAMYAIHPHGVLSCGPLVNGIHHAKFAEVKARWLVAENLFWFPVIRDVLKWWNFSHVQRWSFVEAMEKQQNIGFCPGGFEEATLYERGKHRVFLKKRFGFIKLALQYGYKVHPVYTFGEEFTYHAFPYFLDFRLKLNEFKFPGVAFMGNVWCFFMPKSDIELITVVGKPLQFPRIEHPAKADVAKYHELYVNALIELFETHKTQFAANPDATLEVY